MTPREKAKARMKQPKSHPLSDYDRFLIDEKGGQLTGKESHPFIRFETSGLPFYYDCVAGEFCSTSRNEDKLVAEFKRSIGL